MRSTGDEAWNQRSASEDTAQEATRKTGREGTLALDAVSHGFGEASVLKEVTLAVDRGEVVAIIGPSGTGKTTLLRLLGLFSRPREGTVRMDGNDLWACSKNERLHARRRTGMVFQEAALFGTTVHRNVRYGRHVRKAWSARIGEWVARIRGDRHTRAVAEALDVVGLSDAADRPASSLSGGEKQRVSFARALAYDPAFLLLDEPTSDLDPRNTAVIEEAVRTARGRDIGVALATHDMHQAERIADRVAVMLDGRLIEIGPTERVFTDPADPRARLFIDGELVY